MHSKHSAVPCGPLFFQSSNQSRAGEPDKSGLNGRPTNHFAYGTVGRLTCISKLFSALWHVAGRHANDGFAIGRLVLDIWERPDFDPPIPACRSVAIVIMLRGLEQVCSTVMWNQRPNARSQQIRRRLLFSFCIIEVRSQSSLNLGLQLHY